VNRTPFDELKIKLFGSAGEAVSSLSELGIEIQNANTEYQEFLDSANQQSKTQFKMARSIFSKEFKIKYDLLFSKSRI
jgi:UDP-3-O-acyl-N-acetylglucosamine deacetylase